MDLRAITGYIALALIAGYWVWVLSGTTPELRRGTRDRELRLKILLVKTAALVLTALTVATIHFWATQIWHVLVAVPVAAAGFWLRRVYRRLVAAPRHRLPLGQRIRRTGHLHIIAPPHGRHPAHRGTTAVPAPRIPPGQIPTISPVTPVAPVDAAPITPTGPTAPTAPITPNLPNLPNLPEQAGAT